MSSIRVNPSFATKKIATHKLFKHNDESGLSDLEITIYARSPHDNLTLLVSIAQGWTPNSFSYAQQIDY